MKAIPLKEIVPLLKATIWNLAERQGTTARSSIGLLHGALAGAVRRSILAVAGFAFGAQAAQTRLVLMNSSVIFQWTASGCQVGRGLPFGHYAAVISLPGCTSSSTSDR